MDFCKSAASRVPELDKKLEDAMNKILSKKLKNNKGITLAEMVVVIAITVILLALATINIFAYQRKLRQTELDAKAEVIYSAVQNRLTKLVAAGMKDDFANNDKAKYKADGTAEQPHDWDDFYDGTWEAGLLCYFTSNNKSTEGTAANYIITEDLMDDDLYAGNWVVEYNPETGIVWGVFYSEKESIDYPENTYNSDDFRGDKKIRQNDIYKAHVGYYGGGTSNGETGKSIVAGATVNNYETLTVDIWCRKSPDEPAFLVTLTDIYGHSYTVCYASPLSVVDGSIQDAVQQRINDGTIDKCDAYDYDVTYEKGTGNYYKFSLTLDDLSSADKRFDRLYGKSSGHADNNCLVAGTPVEISVVAFVPGDATVKDGSDAYYTNSLFAGSDADETYFNNGSNDNTDAKRDYGTASAENGAVDRSVHIEYARHLQNLDSSSGVLTAGTVTVNTDSTSASYDVHGIESAVQTKTINFSAAIKDTNVKNAADIAQYFYSTYSSKYFNGTVADTARNNKTVPNFKPIENTNLKSYDAGKYDKDGKVTGRYQIADLSVSTGAAAGLFGEVKSSLTLSNLELTGASVKATDAAGNAGSLVGTVSSGTVTIKNCVVYLTEENIDPETLGKGNENNLRYTVAWVDAGNAAGGLVGAVTSEGTLEITSSSASTVVGAFTTKQEKSGSETVTLVDSVTADYAGGLIGSDSGAQTKITGSYADSYVTGVNAGGLIGGGSGSAEIESCYVAGYAAFTENGAGVVYGTDTSLPTVTNSYTILHVINSKTSDSDNVKYYRVGNTAGVNNAWYMNGSINVEQAIDEEYEHAIDKLSGDELAEKLDGTYFTKPSDMTVNATAYYNLMNQGISRKYEFPMIEALGHHYGDWNTEFQAGSIVYYEKYGDNTYGFEGAGVVSTLKDGAVGDGYGIVFKDSSDIPTTVTVEITGYDADNTAETVTIDTQSATYYTVTGSDGTKYRVYPLEADLMNKEIINGDGQYKFWLKAKVTAGTAVSYFRFNPHFAKTNSEVEESYQPNDDRAALNGTYIYVRTARQLYNLSRFYDDTPSGASDGYKTTTASATFLQECNINYESYDWSSDDFCTRPDPVVHTPIGRSGSGFAGTYNGQGKWIYNISITTASYNAGLFGMIAETGTVRNVVLRADYDYEASGDNSPLKHYVSNVSSVQRNNTLTIGALAGINDGKITNCSVDGFAFGGTSKNATMAAYQDSTLYAGGLVGRNYGEISNCSADTPVINLEANYATVAVGGFVGMNDGTISNSYALGFINVSSSRGGSVSIAGFAGDGSGSINSSYCATALISAGDASKPYAFAPSGGSVSADCYYINNGTYNYLDNLYLYNFDADLSSASAKNYADFETYAIGSEAAVSYDFSYTSREADAEQYPFRAVVTNAAGQLVHYGEWLQESELGSFGVFYWEYESGGNEGYHFSFIGDDYSDPNKPAQLSGNTLCTAHEDGGVITSYGYGYFTQKNVNLTVELTDVKASLTTDAKGTVTSETINKDASEALQKQMNAGSGENYIFHAFTTGYGDTSSTADYIYMSATSASTRNSSIKLTQTVTKGSKTESHDVTYYLSPFFGNSLSRSNDLGTDKSYEIRSAQQLQYINWNCDSSKHSATEYLKYDDFNNTNVEPAYWSCFTYLGYAIPNGATGTKIENTADLSWLQTHDTNSNGNTFTPIGTFCETFVTSSTSTSEASKSQTYAAYLNGSYDGQFYTIKNVSINSESQAVGLFGALIDGSLKNIILYSDSDCTITNSSATMKDGLYYKYGSWYSLGGLCGIAANGQGGKGEISNCTVSGYNIVDGRGACGFGGSNIGGVVGLTNISMTGCTSVNNIKIATTYDASYANERNIRVGGLVGNFRGQTLSNCYTGGSIEVSDANKAYTHVAGLVGGYFVRSAGNLGSLFGGLTALPEIKDCYTYVDLSGCTSNNHILSRRPIVTLADESDSVAGDRFNVSNCYFYSQNGVEYTGLDRHLGLTHYPQDTIGTLAIQVTYEQLSYTEQYDEGVITKTSGEMTPEEKVIYLVNGKSITTALGWGDDSTVTIWADSGKTIRMDGTYSHPGESAGLEGKNYPFPTVIVQNGHNVHYGAWPYNGMHWESARASMDMFSDMYSGDDTAKQGWAYKTFKLTELKDAANPTEITFTYSSGGSTTATYDGSSWTVTTTESPKYAVVSEVSGSGSALTVTVKALNHGSSISSEEITAAVTGGNGKTETASFTLSITANIELSSDPPVYLKQFYNDTTPITFYAKTPAAEGEESTQKDYSTADTATWELIKFDPEGIVLDAEASTAAKNIKYVKRVANGRATLEARYSYYYGPTNEKTDYELNGTYYLDKIYSPIYLNLRQTDSIGISALQTARSYVEAALDSATTGTAVSYSASATAPDPQTANDYFVYLVSNETSSGGSKEHSLSEFTVKSITADGATVNQEWSELETGNYYTVCSTGSDSLYEYIIGRLYYYGTEDDGQTKAVSLAVTLIGTDGKEYTLTVPATAQVVTSPVTITYKYTNTDGEEKEPSVDVLSAAKMPTSSDSIVSGIYIPEGKELTGWTDGTMTYTPGSVYTFTEDTTLTAVISYPAESSGYMLMFNYNDYTSAPELSAALQSEDEDPAEQTEPTGETGDSEATDETLQQSADEPEIVTDSALMSFGVSLNNEEPQSDEELQGASSKVQGDEDDESDSTEAITEPSAETEDTSYLLTPEAVTETYTLEDLIANYRVPEIGGGRVIVGWAETEGGEIVCAADPESVIEYFSNATQSIVLYAVEAVAQPAEPAGETGGDEVPAEQITPHSSLELITDCAEYDLFTTENIADYVEPTSEGYVFEGWSDAMGEIIIPAGATAEELGEYIASLEEDTTLWAMWSGWLLTPSDLTGESWSIISDAAWGESQLLRLDEEDNIIFDSVNITAIPVDDEELLYITGEVIPEQKWVVFNSEFEADEIPSPTDGEGGPLAVDEDPAEQTEPFITATQFDSENFEHLLPGEIIPTEDGYVLSQGDKLTDIYIYDLISFRISEYDGTMLLNDGTTIYYDGLLILKEIPSPTDGEGGPSQTVDEDPAQQTGGETGGDEVPAQQTDESPDGEAGDSSLEVPIDIDGTLTPSSTAAATAEETQPKTTEAEA